MDDAKEIRGVLEKEFAKLRKASEAVEARLKSALDEFATHVRALEKVVGKEFVPNVSAKLKAFEKGLVAYKKASEKELTRLKKAYDKELTKLREAKGGVARKTSESSKAKPTAKNPAKAKTRRAAQSKVKARRAAKPKTTARKPGIRKSPSSGRRKSAAAITTKRLAAKTATSRTRSPSAIRINPDLR